MKRATKVLLCVLTTILIIFAGVILFYKIITADTKLDTNKLFSGGNTITVYDDNENKIIDTTLSLKRESIKIENLNKDTINALIASEDKTFYKHNGINLKRIIKATYKNFVSRSFKEGASTITQQLIKNTHLNNDKNIARKLKEIKLSLELEKQYSKDKILEAYLNTIYFGHGCYGIECASKFYYGIPANELNLEQSATLVGLLTSPNNYSPFKNPEKSINRRNTVLKCMLKCGYINNQTYEKTIKEGLSAEQNNTKNIYQDYLNEVFSELDGLNLNPYDCNQIKIYTYLNKTAQDAVENLSFENDGIAFIRTNCGGVCAYKTTCKDIKRQIGSTAKPIFVYAPAINENKIHLFTKILDEKVDYNGYSPENYDKKYHGYVTVENAIAQSLNIPAVKVLNTITPKVAVKYADKLGMPLSDNDENLAISLGATNSEFTLKQLCDAYSVFPMQGIYKKSAFIKSIYTNKNKKLYENNLNGENVFKPSTASLINKSLITSVKCGTAKKLNDLNFEVACKTGTCGNNIGNTDAYSVAYTSKHVIGIWCGDKNYKRLNITGGTTCCNKTKQVLERIYENDLVPPLDTSTNLKEIEIDKKEYEENNNITLCDDICPRLNRIKVVCSLENSNIAKLNNFSYPTIKFPSFSVKNNNIIITLCQTEYYDYIIKRRKNGKLETVYKGKWIEEFSEILEKGEYEYCVTPYYRYENKDYFGKEIWLKKIYISNSENKTPPPNITNKDWENM